MIVCLLYWYVTVTMEQSSVEMKNWENKSLLMQVFSGWTETAQCAKDEDFAPQGHFCLQDVSDFPSFVVLVLLFKCAGQRRRVQQLQVSRRTWVRCWAGWIKQTLSWLLLFILQSHNTSEILWAKSRYGCCFSRQRKWSTELSVRGCVLNSNLI